MIKRIRLFMGHYGSGKSEVSINYVTRLRKIVDEEKCVGCSSCALMCPDVVIKVERD